MQTIISSAKLGGNFWERIRAKNSKSAICKIGVVAIGTRELPINCWGDSDYKEKSQDAIVRTMKSEIALTVWFVAEMPRGKKCDSKQITWQCLCDRDSDILEYGVGILHCICIAFHHLPPQCNEESSSTFVCVFFFIYIVFLYAALFITYARNMSLQHRQQPNYFEE